MSDNQKRIVRLSELERQAILEAVGLLGGVGAARALGVAPSKVYRKLNHYGVTPAEARARLANGGFSPPPASRLIDLQDLAPLLLAARAVCDHLDRCVGTAHKLGQDLSYQVKLLTEV